MTLCRAIHDKGNPFVVVNKSITSDSRVSWKGKGLWLYAFSRPDDWQFYVSEICQHAPDGEKSVYSGLKELEDAGYLYRSQSRTEDGGFGKMVWLFFETSKTQDEIEKMLPQPQKGDAVKRRAANGALQKKEGTKEMIKETTSSLPPSSAKKPKQQPAAPAVVVDSSTSKKKEPEFQFSGPTEWIDEAIGEADADKLRAKARSARYDVSLLQAQFVAGVKDGTISSPGGYLAQAIKEKWRPSSQSPQKRVLTALDLTNVKKRYEVIAERINARHGQKNHIRIDCAPNHLEIIYLGSQKIPDCIPWTDPNLDDRFVSLLVTRGIKM